MSTVMTCLLAAIIGTVALAVMMMGRCTREALSRSYHDGDGKATLPLACQLLLHFALMLCCMLPWPELSHSLPRMLFRAATQMAAKHRAWQSVTKDPSEATKPQ